jgi:selenocysteine-specific elongation factor
MSKRSFMSWCPVSGVVCISEKGQARFIARDAWQELLKNLERLLEQKHREQPLVLSQRIGSLAKELRVEASLLELATNEPAFESLGRDRIKLRSHSLCLSGSDAQAAEALRRIYLDSGLQAPAVSEAIEAVLREGIAIKSPRVEQILEALVESGDLRRIAERVVIHDQAFQGALERTLAALRERGPLSASEFREVLDSSRKFVIPLLESFDELGYTSRQGEARTLGPKA